MQSWLAQKSCLVCCCLSLTVVYSDRHMGLVGWHALASTCFWSGDGARCYVFFVLKLSGASPQLRWELCGSLNEFRRGYGIW